MRQPFGKPNRQEWHLLIMTNFWSQLSNLGHGMTDFYWNLTMRILSWRKISSSSEYFYKISIKGSRLEWPDPKSDTTLDDHPTGWNWAGWIKIAPGTGGNRSMNDVDGLRCHAAAPSWSVLGLFSKNRKVLHLPIHPAFFPLNDSMLPFSQGLPGS